MRLSAAGYLKGRMTNYRLQIVLHMALLWAPYCAATEPIVVSPHLTIQPIHQYRSGIAYEHLTWESIHGAGERRDVWRRDWTHSRELSASDDDYRAARPLIKFHLAPAKKGRRSQAEIDGTFTYANAPLGNDKLNGGLWRVLEKDVVDLVQPTTEVYVVTGPAFMPDDKGIVSYPVYGPHNVPKPTHFVKAVLKLANGQPSMFAVIVPNEAPPAGKTWKDFRVSVDRAELALGEDCFDWLDDATERKLEAQL